MDSSRSSSQQRATQEPQAFYARDNGTGSHYDLNRGRSTTKKENMNFSRHTELVKNIQRVDDSGAISGALKLGSSSSTSLLLPQRSREASVHSLHSGNEDRLRPNRFRHPMNAYNNDATFETIAPNLLYQKYQQSQQQLVHESRRGSVQPSTMTIHSKANSLKRVSVSVSMDSDLVPAFDDMRMDIGDEHVSDEPQAVDATDGFSTSDVDNRYTTDSADLNLGTVGSSPGSPQMEQPDESMFAKTPQTIGRIQHRITALKALQDHDDQTTWRSQFLNIEQKTLLNSTNNELQSLRRSNYRPLLQSVQRMFRSQDDSTLHGSDHHDPEYHFIKPYNPLMTMDSPHTLVKNREPAMDKLKDLLHKSSKIVDSLWVDAPMSNKSSTSTGFQGSPALSNAMHLETIPSPENMFNSQHAELNVISEQFGQYQLNKPHLVQRLSDASPRTVV